MQNGSAVFFQIKRRITAQSSSSSPWRYTHEDQQEGLRELLVHLGSQRRRSQGANRGNCAVPTSRCMNERATVCSGVFITRP